MSTAPIKITYKVIFASSSDSNHTEKELEIRNDNSTSSAKENDGGGSTSGTNNHSGSHGRGWQSERFCDFPQYLIVHLIDICEIKQIQILSHQSKIASKIEIWVASDSRLTWKYALKAAANRDEAHSYHSINHNTSQYWKKVTWKRLGYLSLDKNERSNWKARELKSVYIDTKANLIKFALHESHINTINLFNQTGIVSLNVLGTPMGIIAPPTPHGAGDTSNTSNTNNTNTKRKRGGNTTRDRNNSGNNNNNNNMEGEQDTIHGSATRKARKNNDNNNNNNNNNSNNTNNSKNDIIIDENKYDPATANKLRELLKQKQLAVEREDYDEAKQCKMAIENLEKVASELIKLENNKKLAVEREDYDEAKSLKLQIIRLRELSLNPQNIASQQQQQQQQQQHLPRSHQTPRAMHQAQHGQYSQQQQAVISPAMANMPHMGSNGMYNQMPPIHSRQASNQSHHSMHSIHSHRSHYSDHQSHQSLHSSHHDTPPAGIGMQGGMMPQRYNAADERAIRPMGGKFEFGTMDVNNLNPFGSRGNGGAPSQPPQQHVNPYEEQPILPPTGDPFEKFKNAGEDDIPPPAKKRVPISSMNNNNRNGDNESEHSNNSINASNGIGGGGGDNGNNGFGMGQKRGMSSNGGNSNGDGKGPPPLKASVRKDCENLIRLLGENIVTLLYSPTWSHRNEGLTKILESLNGNSNDPSININNNGDKREVFKLICKVVYKAFNDKVAHVFLTGIDVFNSLLETFHSKVKMDDVYKFSHSLVLSLVNTLGHSNTRIVDAAGSMLISLSHHDPNLARSVYHELLKPMRRELPKHLKGRGVVLLELIPQFQVPKGIQISQFMQLVKVQLLNKNGDVRDIGVQITTMLYQICGNQILSFLDDLNDFSKETLNNAFEEATGQSNVLERAPKSQTEQRRPSKTMGRTSNTSIKRKSTSIGSNNNNHNKIRKSGGIGRGGGRGGGGPGASSRQSQQPKRGGAGTNKRGNTNTNTNGKRQQQQGKRSRVNSNSPTKRNRNNSGSPSKRGGGMSPMHNGSNSNNNNNNTNNNDGEDEEEYEDMCNFCGLRDESFSMNEENLDLHYWQACPMLTSCKLCEQVIEIPTLHEHILTECEAAEKHQQCNKCGIPFPVSQIKQHRNENNCRASLPLDKANRCTLCNQDIEPYEQGWRKHLLTYPGCPQNERPLPPNHNASN